MPSERFGGRGLFEASALIPLRTWRIFLTACLAVCVAPQVAATCDTFDYAGEFVITNVQLLGQTSLPADLVELEFSAQLHNTAGSTLDDAVAAPDFGSSAANVLMGAAANPAWQFGTVTAFATQASTVGGELHVSVPADQVDVLIEELSTGVLPVRVTGNERLVLKPDVHVLPWRSDADENYDRIGSIATFNDLHLFENFPFEDAAVVSEFDWSVEMPGGTGPNVCVGTPGPSDQFYVYEGVGSGTVDAPGAVSGETFPQRLRTAVFEVFVFESLSSTPQECEAAAASESLGVGLRFNPAGQLGHSEHGRARDVLYERADFSRPARCANAISRRPRRPRSPAGR